MNKQQLNSYIKTDISLYVQLYGSYNTRDLISALATKYNTPKQRISGNISFVVTKLHQHHITTIIPKKESYIH
jgi:hypothetical protein